MPSPPDARARSRRRWAAVIAAVLGSVTTVVALVSALDGGFARPLLSVALALALVGANLAPVLAISGGRIDAFTPVGALLVPIGLLLPLPEAIVVYALGEGVGVLAAHRLDRRVGGPEADAAERNAFVIGKSVTGAAIGLAAMGVVAGPDPGVVAQLLAAVVGVGVSTLVDHTAVAWLGAAVGDEPFRSGFVRGAGELSLVASAEVVVGASLAILADRDPWSLVLGLGMLALLMVAGSAYSRAAADRVDRGELLRLAESLQQAETVDDVERELLTAVRRALPRDDVELVSSPPGQGYRSWKLSDDPAEPRWLVTPRLVDTRDYEQQPLAVIDAAVSLARVALTRAEAQERLAEQDQLRALVLATVAHDLRGPLGIAVGGIELLQDRDDLTGLQARGLVDVAHRGLRRMQQLIDDLLDLERAEQRSGDPAADIATVLATVLEDLPRTDVVAEAPAEPVAVAMAPVSLGRVLANLIGNARKYSPEGQPITVRWARSGDATVLITVQDRGPGVPEHEREAIFEPFEQAGLERGGHGLGLYVTRRFVDRHGGRIWVEQADGGGAAFHVIVPAAELDPAESGADEVRV